MEDVKWDNSKVRLVRGLRTRIQTSFTLCSYIQENESPRDFADRCKGLAQKVMRKVDDPEGQRIHRENADRKLLSNFVAGLGENRKTATSR